MHGVAPRMCGQVVHPSLGGGAGGRSPGSIYADTAVEKVRMLRCSKLQLRVCAHVGRTGWCCELGAIDVLRQG